MRSLPRIFASSCSDIAGMSTPTRPPGEDTMPLTLRPGRPEDATLWGTICYEAFKTIAEQHNFPTNYPAPAVAIERMRPRLTHPGGDAFVANLDGTVVGSTFLDALSAIPGL